MIYHIKGKPLRDFNDNETFYQGNVFRLFGVDRYDVMKLVSDRTVQDKMQKDFYDLMLVDISSIMPYTFILVNVTSDSDNKGRVFGLIEGVETKGFVKALFFKTYFENHDTIFLLDY